MIAVAFETASAIRTSSITYAVPSDRFTFPLIVNDVLLAIALISYHVVTAVGSVVPNPILAPTAILSVVNCVLLPVIVVDEPFVETVPLLWVYTIALIDLGVLLTETVDPDKVIKPLYVKEKAFELNSMSDIVLVVAAVALVTVKIQ